MPERPAFKPSLPVTARGRAAEPEALHVAPAETLASVAMTVARQAERAVYQEQRRADRAIAMALRGRRGLAAPDLRFIAQSVNALFRWHGWVEGQKISRIEERMLLSWLLDSPMVHPVCRIWAKAVDREPSRLVPFGDAPNWTARAEGLKRWVEGRGVNADPWRLFPDWLREHLPMPPGGQSPKAKYLELLQAFQTRPPLWVRVQEADRAADGAAVWKELRELGLKPWVHRTITRAAKLEVEADVPHLPPYERGVLEIQDLASQAVALVCDPDPGERWWDACAGAGGKALHLAALMGGKGVVVATDSHEGRLKETVRRARKSPFRNITTKEWNGETARHPAGKSGSFDGVLVDAPCSAIGTWRRNPDARWSLDRDAIPRLAELQAKLLRAAAPGVKPGGLLVYSVCTLTPDETTRVIDKFLADFPEFHLDPFPHPFTAEPTKGTLLLWPQESDTDAMFIARMIRSTAAKPAKSAAESA